LYEAANHRRPDVRPQRVDRELPPPNHNRLLERHPHLRKAMKLLGRKVELRPRATRNDNAELAKAGSAIFVCARDAGAPTEPVSQLVGRQRDPVMLPKHAAECLVIFGLMFFVGRQQIVLADATQAAGRARLVDHLLGYLGGRAAMRERTFGNVLEAEVPERNETTCRPPLRFHAWVV
jgi:hypothetical protein